MPRKRKEPAPPKDPGNPSPTYGAHYPPEAVTDDEVEAILRVLRGPAATATRNRALVWVLWKGGLRISEATALRPTNVEFGVHTRVRVLRGKGGKTRQVALGPTAAARVQEWLARRAVLWPDVPRNAPVFCTRTGARMQTSYARDMLHATAAKAGIDRRVHPHAFRHAFTINHVRNGTPMPMIQQLLGHSSLATTSTYVSSLSPEEAMGYVWELD